MKKFGTPMAAGPGIASESVGFANVGVPSGAWGAFGLACLVARLPARVTLSVALPTILPAAPVWLPEPARVVPEPAEPLEVFPEPLVEPWEVEPPPEPPLLPPPLEPLDPFPAGVGEGVGVPVTRGTGGTVGAGATVGAGVGVATGPRSTTLCTGAESAGSELAAEPPG